MFSCSGTICAICQHHRCLHSNPCTELPARLSAALRQSWSTGIAPKADPGALVVILDAHFIAVADGRGPAAHHGICLWPWLWCLVALCHYSQWQTKWRHAMLACQSCRMSATLLPVHLACGYCSFLEEGLQCTRMPPNLLGLPSCGLHKIKTL